MSYNGYITRIKNIRKHNNADRLNVGYCFNNPIIISKDIIENQLGVYFPTDGKLSKEFCEINNLLRKKDKNGNQIGGYLDPNKRHITTLKLRGEFSDGLFLPLESLKEFYDIKLLKEGDSINVLNGHLICEKYIPNIPKNNNPLNDKKIKKIKMEEIYPLFDEHKDTSQLAYNMNKFRVGDLCYITLKLHGTSQRTTYTLKKEKNNIVKRIICKISNIKPANKWEYVSGTRRVILKNYNGGYYGDNKFRQKYHDIFKNKLKKGETVYYEIVGFINEDTPIMASCNNKKIKDENFIKQYGEVTNFTYGCNKGENDMYIYRMTITNEDGDVIEYNTEQTKLRCEEMGVKFVPILDKFFFTTEEDLKNRVDTYVDGADIIGKTHIREGVVVRIDNRKDFTALKHKNYFFKTIEGITKEENQCPDVEEIQDIIEN